MRSDRRRRGTFGSRISVVAPIGLIVIVAFSLMVVAVIKSAERADEVARQHDRQLFDNAIVSQRERVLRELESVTVVPGAIRRTRLMSEPDWVHLRIGLWLKTFFDHDMVFVVDTDDQFSYALLGRTSEDPASVAHLKPDLAPVIAQIRERAAPDETLRSEAADPLTGLARPRRAARLQTFMDRPAVVAAVAATNADVAHAAHTAPLVISVKFIDAWMLAEISSRAELANLHNLEGDFLLNGEAVLHLKDGTGEPIARFRWTPKRPGAEIVRNVLPFLGLAFAGFTLLAAFTLRYIRRAAARIAEGEDRLRHLAMHDPLSGLPNRAYFGERLAAAIARVRARGGLAAVLSIDLDHFKDINDTLGHHVGDALIRAVAQRIGQVLRAEDLVARLGGDEFAVIATDVADAAALDSMAGRIIGTLRAPFVIMNHTLVIGASVGIATIDEHSVEAADVMRRADVALYRAKNDGRNQACIYDADMDAGLRQTKQIEIDLREAIASDGLAVAYQPVVNASGERTVAVEALCRWYHPQRGEITPGEFIPIAERSELIIPLGEWVLRRACLEARDWADLTLAVNVSPLQFRRPDFVETIERTLAETGFDPHRLELELTESTLLGNVANAENAMHRLKARGVRLALDDFGTGYSSLLYLRRYPFDKIKIDRSFVRAIDAAADAASIVHAVVSLGRGLGMKVTAEGVENAEQHLFLRAAGVHSMQGFRFGHPEPAAAITARLAREAPQPRRAARAAG
ncbi:MAG: EAL domain-containing protein [Xanthobacteraceae bacterium]|nr:EAL domain-containing protein [Xanthobacteraceae bacterium]